jgi:hypothetical protein
VSGSPLVLVSPTHTAPARSYHASLVHPGGLGLPGVARIGGRSQLAPAPILASSHDPAIGLNWENRGGGLKLSRGATLQAQQPDTLRRNPLKLHEYLSPADPVAVAELPRRAEL